MSENIHPTAVLHPSAKVHPTVKIGPYAVIGEDVEIGAGSTIGAHAILEFVRMGEGNVIHPHACVGTPPQDLKYAANPTRTHLVMGDRNTARECVTLNRGAHTPETRIGSNCLFMACSHVAHDCRIGSGVILVNSVGIAGHVEVGDNTVIGGIVGIHQFVRVGRFCMLGGGSMLGKDVPSFGMVQGDRATLRGLNLLGMRRAGFSREAMQAVKDAYKTLFLSGKRVGDALAELKASGPGPEVSEMLDFIAAALKGKRGLIRPAPTGGAAREEEEVTI